MFTQWGERFFALFWLLISVILFSSYTYAEQGNKEAGKKIYEVRCLWCHGATGEGNGFAAQFTNVRPRDFTSGIFKFKRSLPGQVAADEDLFRTISNGLPGTPMPSWKLVLSDKERWDVIEYIKSFTDIFESEKASGVVDYKGEIPYSVDSVNKGREAFKKAKCYECHGENAKGDGMKKLKDDWDDREWPRNLTKPWTFRGGNDVKDIFTRVTVGIPGTQMPSFASATGLTENERWHVANYVKSLVDEAKRPVSPQTVLRAKYIKAALPNDVNAAEWNETPSAAFKLFPQLIENDKLRGFRPTNDSVTARVLFNEKEIAFLIEWDDRTKSVIGDPIVEKLSEGEVFEDAIAIQLRVGPPTAVQQPYPGHGDKTLGVEMWYWGIGNTSGGQAIKTIDANGFGTEKIRDAGRINIKGTGEYKAGIWKVILRRSLTTSNTQDDFQFERDVLIPVTFANWDGSNGEKGSKHTLTNMHWLQLEP